MKMNNTNNNKIQQKPWADYDPDDDSLPEIPKSWILQPQEKEPLVKSKVTKKKVVNRFNLLYNSDSD